MKVPLPFCQASRIKVRKGRANRARLVISVSHRDYIAALSLHVFLPARHLVFADRRANDGLVFPVAGGIAVFVGIKDTPLIYVALIPNDRSVCCVRYLAFSQINVRTAAAAAVAAGNACGRHSIASSLAISAPVIAPVVGVITIPVVGCDRATGDILTIAHLAFDVGPPSVTFSTVSSVDDFIIRRNDVGILGSICHALRMPTQPILNGIGELREIILETS